MQEIRCQNPTCNKLLLEATGEVKKRCPKCGTWTHVVVTSTGIIPISSMVATGQYGKLSMANESELKEAERCQDKFSKAMDKANRDSPRLIK